MDSGRMAWGGRSIAAGDDAIEDQGLVVEFAYDFPSSSLFGRRASDESHLRQPQLTNEIIGDNDWLF
jgi:hypothetical protein